MCKLKIKREMWTKPTYAKSSHIEVITAARGATEVAQRSVQKQTEEALRQSPEERQYLKDEQMT